MDAQACKLNYCWLKKITRLWAFIYFCLCGEVTPGDRAGVSGNTRETWSSKIDWSFSSSRRSFSRMFCSLIGANEPAYESKYTFLHSVWNNQAVYYVSKLPFQQLLSLLILFHYLQLFNEHGRKLVRFHWLTLRLIHSLCSRYDNLIHLPLSVKSRLTSWSSTQWSSITIQKTVCVLWFCVT